jgi:hypothetical protein
MTPAWATAEPGMDPNNLTNQLASILRESFSIEAKGRGCIYQKSYPDYNDQQPYPRGYKVPEFSKLLRKMVKPYYSMLVNLFYNVVKLVLMTR